jgi:hypothetical protein
MLQAFFRGRLARMQFLEMRQENLELLGISFIQRVFRGFLGRSRAFERRLVLARHQAAIMFQAAFRGWLVRKDLVHRKRIRKETNASILIQAAARGFLARKYVRDELNNKSRLAATQTIQRIVRGFICRATLPRRLEDIQNYRNRRHILATKIQKVYRGFRSRVIVRIMRREADRLRAIRDPAATKINCATRQYLARKVLREKMKLRYQQWVMDAKNVKEYWSEEYNVWYYVKEDTGESLWEPPAQGYTKNDAQLILANGQEINDPTLYRNEAEDVAGFKPVDSKFCSECTTHIAVRLCLQCGDKFCCPCYKEQHATGSRLRHVSYNPLILLCDINVCSFTEMGGVRSKGMQRLRDSAS